MRIRKRLHSPLPPPDLSSPPPLSTAATVASVAAAEGAGSGKEGEVARAAAAGLVLHGLGGESSRGGGRRLHPNGDLPAQTFPGCTTNPTTSLPFHPPPDAVPTAEGGERGDLPPRGTRLLRRDVPPNHGHGGQALKRQRDVDGEARIRRWNAVVLGGASAGAGASASAPKSSSVGVPAVSLGHGGHKTPDNGQAAVAQAAARWSDEEKDSTLKKRMRGCHRARGSRSRPQELEKNTVAGAMKPRPSKTRRVSTSSAAASTATITAAGANYSLVTTGGGSGGAPKATGAGAAKCDDVVAKEEGGDDMSVERVAAVNGDRSSGCGNGKKRRSPAVLMEGSRCSRVNGRGWRCCQQTLVGYSLCEHHLGKGRLRSVASVRCIGRVRKKEEAEDGAASSLPFPVLQQKQRQLLWGNGEDEEENLCKRRRKIGTVKARSISSLLHRPDYSMPTTMDSPSSSSSPPPPAPPEATGGTSISAVSPPHGSSNCAVA